MKIGVMQPYFIPYIGYWQLINAVDQYVVYDDVNYRRGWINRNRILNAGEVQYFNIPLCDSSQNKLINEIEIDNDYNILRKRLRTIETAYRKAPYFLSVYPLMEKIFFCEEKKLAMFLLNSIQILCDYLNIRTKLILSSSLEKDCQLRGAEKIIEICKVMGATEYYNAIGGIDLYSFYLFREFGLQLKFIKTKKIQYNQFNHIFQENLSILDIMMFNSTEQIAQMLQEYDLVIQ